MKRTGTIAASLFVPATVLVGLYGCNDASPGQQDRTGSNPNSLVAIGDLTVHEGHVSCADLGLGTTSTRVEDPAQVPVGDEGARTYTLSGGHAVNVRGCFCSPDSNEASLRWTSSIALEAFIIQGVPPVPPTSESPHGPRSNVYRYDPPALASASLYPPDTADDIFTHYQGVTAIEFCYTLVEPNADGGTSSGGTSSGGTSSGGTSSGGTSSGGSSDGGSSDGGSSGGGKTW